MLHSGAGEMKRKDSGYSVDTDTAGSEDDAAAPKTRDFAVKKTVTNAHANMNTPRPVAAAAVTIKAGKEDQSVWRRMKVTVGSRLGSKG